MRFKSFEVEWPARLSRDVNFMTFVSERRPGLPDTSRGGIRYRMMCMFCDAPLRSSSADLVASLGPKETTTLREFDSVQPEGAEDEVARRRGHDGSLKLLPQEAPEKRSGVSTRPKTKEAVPASAPSGSRESGSTLEAAGPNRIITPANRPKKSQSGD